MPRNFAQRPDDQRLGRTRRPMTLEQMHQKVGEVPVYDVGTEVRLPKFSSTYPIVGMEARGNAIWLKINISTTSRPAIVYRRQTDIRKLNPVTPIARKDEGRWEDRVRIGELERELRQAREMLERERERHEGTRELMLSERKSVEELRTENQELRALADSAQRLLDSLSKPEATLPRYPLMELQNFLQGVRTNKPELKGLAQ
jgi:hypothetical protein